MLFDQLQDNGAVDDIAEGSETDKGDAEGRSIHAETITDALQNGT